MACLQRREGGPPVAGHGKPWLVMVGHCGLWLAMASNSLARLAMAGNGVMACDGLPWPVTWPAAAGESMVGYWHRWLGMICRGLPWRALGNASVFSLFIR